MICCGFATSDARTRTVASIQRTAAFIPETKKVNELLREMQRAKQHMHIVIDEYGGVAGLVTIEDLIEEIVGSITDEHEADDAEAVTREADGSWLVPGNLPVERLEELLDKSTDLPKIPKRQQWQGLSARRRDGFRRRAK